MYGNQKMIKKSKQKKGVFKITIDSIEKTLDTLFRRAELIVFTMYLRSI